MSAAAKKWHLLVEIRRYLYELERTEEKLLQMETEWAERERRENLCGKCISLPVAFISSFIDL